MKTLCLKLERLAIYEFVLHKKMDAAHQLRNCTELLECHIGKVEIGNYDLALTGNSRIFAGESMPSDLAHDVIGKSKLDELLNFVGWI